MSETGTKWRLGLRRVMARDITLALTIKVVLLAALLALFARPAFHPANDAAETTAAVAGTAAEVSTRR
jgi:hypothetical protein